MQLRFLLQMYSSEFNIYIVLTGLIIWSDSDHFTIGNDPDQALKDLVKYRKKYLRNTHDSIQLLT